MTTIISQPSRSQRREKIYSHARDILNEYWAKDSPVNLKRLTRKMGITLEYIPLDEDLSGISFIEGGQKYIGVNALHHPNRQRFTIGHEIGHHVLHEELFLSGTHLDTIVLRRDHLSARGTVDVEVEANAFASELLIPQQLLSKRLPEDADMQDEDMLERLARDLKVSLTALHFRLARN